MLCAIGEAICVISSEKHAQMCPSATATGLNPLQPLPQKEGKLLRKRDQQGLGCPNGDVEDSLMHKNFCWINAITHSHAGWIDIPAFCQGVNKVLKSHNCLFPRDAVSWSHLSGSRHRASSPETRSVTCPRPVNVPRVCGHFRISLGTRFGV